MRILQICSAREIGGGERYLANLSNELAKRGHDIIVAIPPNAPLKDELFAVPPENILFSRMRNALDFPSAFEMADFIRRHEIQIVHAHLARDYPLAAMAARKTKVDLMLTRHVLFPLNRLHKRILKNVAGVIAPSNAIDESLKKQKLFPSPKIKLIHYGIDLKYFSPNSKDKQKNFTVLTIGHLAPIKGLDVFIRAAEIVLRQKPDARFIIVGEDKSHDGKNRREIEALIIELNLSDKIELVGWTDDVRSFLNKTDVFVSAARAEAFGLVMPEAMVNEIPVIATRSEGATEIIENGKSGILVPNEDYKMLAQKILELHDDREQREFLGKNGRKRVEENFSLETMVTKTEEFYREVLSRKS